jgi:hypothetical protein
LCNLFDLQDQNGDRGMRRPFLNVFRKVLRQILVARPALNMKAAVGRDPFLTQIATIF